MGRKVRGSTPPLPYPAEKVLLTSEDEKKKDHRRSVGRSTAHLIVGTRNSRVGTP